MGLGVTSLSSLQEMADRVRSARPGVGRARLVCVDGPAGSGKTTLAGGLADRLGAAVLHLDDMYEGWSGLGGVWDRVEEQVLTPLAAGASPRYRRYDWAAGAFAGWVELPVQDVLVIEGCGSAPRAVDGRAALRLFVEAPAQVRLARGLARDGQAVRDEWLRWMRLEAQEFAREGTRERADVVVDGTRPVPVGPDR